MHNQNLNYFCYIDSYNLNLINNLTKTTSVIYRNYDNNQIDLNSIIKIKKICKKKGIKFYLSNNVKLAIKLDLNGAYIPAFEKNLNIKNYKFKKKFKLIGSAHNIKEIKHKELQNVDYIFLSPLFASKKNKKCLEVYKFKNLMKITKKKIISLGGITKKNIKRVNLLDIYGIASISLFNKYKN